MERTFPKDSLSLSKHIIRPALDITMNVRRSGLLLAPHKGLVMQNVRSSIDSLNLLRSLHCPSSREINPSTKLRISGTAALVCTIC